MYNVTHISTYYIVHLGRDDLWDLNFTYKIKDKGVLILFHIAALKSGNNKTIYYFYNFRISKNKYFH